MNYFVTGATGFIGGFFVEQLAARKGQDLHTGTAIIAGQTGYPESAAAGRRRERLFLPTVTSPNPTWTVSE